MINSIKLTNHLGEVLLLELRSPEKSGFFVKNIDGLGPAKSTINMTDGLSFDGSFYNSSRITYRNIVLDLGFYEDSGLSIETIRQKLYRFLPMKREIGIEVQTDNRIGMTSGYVESNEPNIFSKEEGSVVSILCPSAFFFGGDAVLTYFSGINSLFEFPWENPSLTLPLIEFGQVFIDTQKTVLYTGDEPTGVVIYINFLGAVNNLDVHNTTTSQTLSINSTKVTALTGHDFQAGDIVIISTVKGSKSIYLIRAGVAYNILNAVTVINGWFTIDRGDNVFTYTAASGLSNMQFLIEHRILYGGL